MSNYVPPTFSFTTWTNEALSTTLLRESTNRGWGTARANYLGALRAEIALRRSEGRTEGLNLELAERMFSFEGGITVFRNVDEPRDTPPSST